VALENDFFKFMFPIEYTYLEFDVLLTVHRR